MAAPDGPWWWASATATVGIVAGFTLKAWFDAFMERHRERRDDRLRFADERMRAYADFGLLCYEFETLQQKGSDWEDRRKALDQQLIALADKYGDKAPSGDAPEVVALESELAAVKEHRVDLLSQAEERRRELMRLRSLLALIAPASVRTAMDQLVFTLDDDDPMAYDAAFEEFVQVAAADLGRAPSMSKQQRRTEGD